MSGSKKGERRGGARKGRGQFKLGNKLGGRTEGAKNKSKFDPVLGVILNKQNTPLRKEQELEMYFAAVGKRMRLPKEVMLDAMRYFEESGIEWGEVVRANMMKSALSKTPEDQAIFEAAVAGAEQRMREYILMAVDVAYKAAPYVHPRLAAVLTNPGSGDSPLNAVAALFRDLDEAGRVPRYIDHDPGEVSQNKN
jgi:hypothetical protein